MRAAALGLQECIELLLKAGADPTRRDIKGTSAPDCAERAEQSKAQEILKRAIAESTGEPASPSLARAPQVGRDCVRDRKGETSPVTATWQFVSLKKFERFRHGARIEPSRVPGARFARASPGPRAIQRRRARSGSIRRRRPPSRSYPSSRTGSSISFGATTARSSRRSSVEVPLWLAAQLRRRQVCARGPRADAARGARRRHAHSHATHRAQHCTIVPPKWMQFATLRARRSQPRRRIGKSSPPSLPLP